MAKPSKVMKRAWHKAQRERKFTGSLKEFHAVRAEHVGGVELPAAEWSANKRRQRRRRRNLARGCHDVHEQLEMRRIENTDRNHSR